MNAPPAMTKGRSGEGLGKQGSAIRGRIYRYDAALATR